MQRANSRNSGAQPRRKKRGLTVKKVGDYFRRQDIFGHPVGFNLGGEETITTWPGVFVTYALITVMLAYAWVRFNILMYKENPLVTKSELADYYDSSEVVNFDDIDFRVAFAVEAYHTDDRSGKDDDDYVEWVVQLTQQKGKEEFIRLLDYHKCTPEDYSKFYPPGKSYTERIPEIIARGNLYCIDEGQNVEVFGEGDQTDY